MKSIDVFYMNLRYLSVIISSKNSGTFWVIHSLVFHVVNDQYGKIDSFVDDCKIILGSNKNLYKQSRELPKFWSHEMFIFGILWKGTKMLSRGDAQTID